MHSAKRLVNMSTRARRHQSASARVGMFASRCPFSQLSKNQVLLHLERSDWFCIIPCGRRCRACGTFPSSYRSSAHLPATMASSDSSLRFRAPACAPFGFGLRRRFPSSSALRCIPARPPKFLTELSRRVVLLCPAAPARPKPIRALGVGFTASELLAARNSSNETLRRRFICIATHLFVRQDSRIRVAPLTACRPNHISVCL